MSIKPGLVATMGGGLAVLAATTAGVSLDAVGLAALGLAAVRAGRMIAFDLVAEPFRRAFVMTVRDSYGAADTTEPRYHAGWRADVGQLLACPICSGTWSAAGMLGLLAIWPALGWLMVYVFAAAGAAELLNAVIECAQWSGELNRSRVGGANELRLGRLTREALIAAAEKQEEVG